MDVSIVIINFNTFKLTCQCIESIQRHVIGLTYEIILVDNCSIECNPQNFERLFPKLVLINSHTNVGFARGNNAGIEKAQGQFILLLNSDTILKNDAISICKKFLESNKLVAAVSARLEYPNETTQHNCQRFPKIRYKLFELLRLQKILPRKLGGRILLGSFFDYNERVYPDWIWGTFFMFPKDVLEKLPKKKLAEDFFMYVEDMQWCMEFKKLDYRIGFEPSARVIHYMGSSGACKVELIEKHISVFMHRYYSPLRIKILRMLDHFLSR